MHLEEQRSRSAPKYGPFPGSTIAPNYPIQYSPRQPPPQPPPPPPSTPAARGASPAPHHAPYLDSDAKSPPNSSSSLADASTPSRGRRSRSPVEASYVCVDGVCTRMEPGTRTVLLVDQPRRNLAGYLILGVFVTVCFNIVFGLFAVIFALAAMCDVEHRTSMQLGEISLCFSISGIFCTAVVLIVVLMYISLN